VKFVPRHAHIVGRMTIRKSESAIILLNEAAVTKFVLVEAVGPDAAKAGIKVGDLLVVTRLNNIVLDAGKVYVPFIEEKDAALLVTDCSLDELLVQTANGKQFVPFDSLEAAKSLGENPPPAERESEAA
jgi:hypothetical protein